MNYAKIKHCDVANGPGVRVSLFVSGCTHHCNGCFNPETWDFKYGKEFTIDTIEEIVSLLEPDHIRGLSILGGEPFEPANQHSVAALCRLVKQRYPYKTIWCYTGYDYEQDILSGRLGDWNTTKKLIDTIDVLVDGEFELDKKDPSLRFRGSSNQRIIDVKESLSQDKVVLWDGSKEP